MYAFNPKRLSQPVDIQLPLMLKLLRHLNHLTQAELSKALSLDRSTYAYYELGHTRLLWKPLYAFHAPMG